MPDILVRGLNLDTVNLLKERAARNRRSMNSEVRLMLEQLALEHEEEDQGKKGKFQILDTIISKRRKAEKPKAGIKTRKS